MLNDAYELDYGTSGYGSDGLIAQVNAAVASGDYATDPRLASRLDNASDSGYPPFRPVRAGRRLRSMSNEGPERVASSLSGRYRSTLTSGTEASW